MKSIRTKYSGEFKAMAVLKALKEDKTISEIASEYQVHPAQIRKWRKTAKDFLPLLFKDKNNKREKEKDKLIEELYKQIGQLKVELDWVLKKTGNTFK
jgi:transposase